jgi:hypothetical protein
MLFRGMTVATLAILAACSSDPAPVQPDPAPTTSSTPSIAVPTMPAQASEDSPEGAAAFVKHYVDVFNYAAATGDVDELSKLSSPDCEGCQSYIDLYRETYEAGGYFKGSDWALGNLELEFEQSRTNAYVKATAPAGVRRDSENSPEVPGDPENTEIVFSLQGKAPERQIIRFERAGS